MPFQVKDLCKGLNVKIAKDEMIRLFNIANSDRGNLNSKDKGQVYIYSEDRGNLNSKDKGQVYIYIQRTGGI